MAQFIHLFDERDLASIRKVGIKAVKYPRVGEKRIYLFPQTENFVIRLVYLLITDDTYIYAI